MQMEKEKIMQYGLLVGGKWIKTEQKMTVTDKYSEQATAYISIAAKTEVDEAVELAYAEQSQPFHVADRYEILMRTVELLRERKAVLADVITSETGKPLRDAEAEVERATQTMLFSAEEAKRISGEGVPIEAAVGAHNKMAFSIRVPVGVIAAITPFNLPLNLVCHKIGPAIAAGNSVILKPSEVAPISALKLAELLLEAGLPVNRLHVLTGDGATIGQALIDNKRVAMFSFTGGLKVGAWLRQHAGMRKVVLELGNNSGNIVHHDCDVDRTAKILAARSFANAGQVCISVQRIYVQEEISKLLLERLKFYTEQLVVGNPREEKTDIGPMISRKEAIRIEQWVNEAVQDGAVIVAGGKRDGAFYTPTIVTGATPSASICREEIFGPVVVVETYNGVDEAIAKVNDSDYGLQAGVFTNQLQTAMKAAYEIRAGAVIINDTSSFRVDHMPYGGIKQSGLGGKEGPRYAIQEMTDERLIVLDRF